MKVLRPTKTKLTQGYSNGHPAYDFSGRTPHSGFNFDPHVYASFAGIITLSVDKYTTAWRNTGTLTTRDYGNFVKLKGELFQLSAHLQPGSVLPVGTPVKKGDIIGIIGHTGNSSGRHNHTEYRFLNGRNTPVEFHTNYPVTMSETRYKGIDLTNIDSIKVAVDTWAQVRDGDFVRKEEHGELITKYEKLKNELTGQLNLIEAKAKKYKKEMDDFTREAAILLGTTQDTAEILPEIEGLVGNEERIRKLEGLLEDARKGNPIKGPNSLETFILQIRKGNMKLTGNRTYVVAVAIVVFNLLGAILGEIEVQMAINGALAGLGLAGIRATKKLN